MSSSSLDSECLICLENKDGFIAHLSCGHSYHYKCIKQWQKKTKNLKRCCCICEKDTEIINLVGEDEEATFNELKNNYNCCKIL